MALEFRIKHGGAHFLIVFERHLRDGFGVRPTPPLEFGKERTPFALVFEEVLNHQPIPDSRVHALAVKGEDRWGRLPQGERGAADVPGPAVHGAEIADW